MRGMRKRFRFRAIDDVSTGLLRFFLKKRFKSSVVVIHQLLEVIETFLVHRGPLLGSLPALFQGIMPIPVIPPCEYAASRHLGPRDVRHPVGAKRRWWILVLSHSSEMRSRRLGFSHRLSLQADLVGVVDEAVEDGVGQGGIADVLVPVFDGQLAGDEGGARCRGGPR